MRASIIIPLTMLSCAEWPRVDHLPQAHEGLATVDTDQADALWAQLDWQATQTEQEPNDAPGEAPLLTGGQGWLWTGSLDGWGWDPDAEPDRQPSAGCADPPMFPPQEAGDYTGDVDWIGLLPERDGTLCATASLRLAGDQTERRFDMLLYTIDACGQPVQVHTDPGGNVLGYPAGGTRGEWGTWVSADTVLGIALAGWRPDDEPDNPAQQVHWDLAISLVPAGSEDSPSVCPRIPEAW